MSSEEQNTAVTQTTEETTPNATTQISEDVLTTEAIIEQDRSEKILRAKELYSHGSRNFLMKSFAEAADELSEVCALYGELYGELSDELGMPYLLYAKSLIALALDENKVIDVPDEEEVDDDDEVAENEAEAEEITESTNVEGKIAVATNGKQLEDIKKHDTNAEKIEKNSDEKDNQKRTKTQTSDDDEKPSTSNGKAGGEEDDEDNDVASNLQLAWEILELASKIFSRQGDRGLPNLAEVHNELANIEFENNILDAARDDYEKALIVYKDLPDKYRRAMAEIHYKIGLTFLMQQQNKEGAAALKEACNLIAGEIDEIKTNTDLSVKDKNNIQDLEETKQEIQAKITEIEETQAQNIAEVRAALDSYIKPFSSGDVDAGSSKSLAASLSATADGSTSFSSPSSAAITSSSSSSSSKPTDISHLIKRKKPEDTTPESENVASSPAKRPAV